MTFTIKEVSERFQLPASTLRYYEDMGILTNIQRTPNHQRIYTQAHINRLSAICCFKRTGMTIHQLQEFFRYEEDESTHIDAMVDLLEQQKQNIENQLDQLQKDYLHIRKKHAFYLGIQKARREGSRIPVWSDYSSLTRKELP